VAKRTGYIIAFTLLSIAAAFLLPAIPQPAAYHDFADRRAGFGIENVLDVVSNVGFLLAGIAGLVVVLRPRTRFEFAAERWPYGIFFLSLLLTAAGSAYYHLAPDNERLFWDRLPITIALMALIAAQLVDRVSARAGLALLVPMLLAGAGSAVYWIATERAGAGNLVPYVVLQGYAVVILLVLALLLPSRYTRGSDVYWVFAAYVIAKLMELFDRELFALGNLVSGHTLKHLAAAVAGFVVCRMLLRRSLITGERTRLVG
jgi:predicted membrane channel-forming protein YqfA (hemolysin III family)